MQIPISGSFSENKSHYEVNALQKVHPQLSCSTQRLNVLYVLYLWYRASGATRSLTLWSLHLTLSPQSSYRSLHFAITFSLIFNVETRWTGFLRCCGHFESTTAGFPHMKQSLLKSNFPSELLKTEDVEGAVLHVSRLLSHCQA